HRSTQMTMPDRVRLATGILSVSVFILLSSQALADGGSLCLSEQKGNYQIAVFTSPTPLRAGPVDISVLVQEAATRQPAPDVKIVVKDTSRNRRGSGSRRHATFEAATNKLFQAAEFHLNEPGWWQVEIALDGSLGQTQVALDIEVGKPLPRYLAMWPWLTWP